MPLYTYLLVLLLLPLASATTVQPSNDTLPTLDSPIQLAYTLQGGMTVTAIITPLTSNVGLGQPLNSLNQLHITGYLKSVDAHSPSSISSSNIAFISCDLNNNSSNLSPTDIINQAIAQTPSAILLYSFILPHCNISGTFIYTSILSMTSIEDSHYLKNSLDMATQLPSATIADQASSTSGASSAPTNSTGSSSSSSTPAPTTAVAMSILYSITGIITLLFLIIIATGAIRAHRHPERYGPRGGLPGRPRQSRAKGLARAMLETLPIVKFGDGEPAKPENREIELEEGSSEVHQQSNNAAPLSQNVEGEAHPGSTENNTLPPETGIGPDTHGAEGSHTEAHGSSEHLGCSICTEDFEKGEDVRVLPCNHKFHPACIDPWLLNVSGTCPLCRVDLRPVETNATETEHPAEEDTTLPPPLTETEGADAQLHPTRGRLSRRLDAALMRNASSHERIAALRQLRQQQVEAGVSIEGPEAAEEMSRRARLTGRLRDVFRIRTRAMAGPAAAEVPGASATPARTGGMEETL